MSLSISSSDAPDTARWRRWLLMFVLLTLGGLSLLFAFVIVIDPYSSGRLTPLQRVDITIKNQLYANAGRVRDSRFDAAIFGNSHAVRIDPDQLSAATGSRFVQLAIEGTHPPDHHLLLRAFARHHPGGTLVLVLDSQSCEPSSRPFKVPRWLYNESTTDYLANILSPLAVRAAFYRIGILLELRHATAESNGYDRTPWWTRADLASLRESMMKNARPTAAPPMDAPFPSLQELAVVAEGLDADARLLIVFTPTHQSALPMPGTPADLRLKSCKIRAKAIAAARPSFGYLDLLNDDQQAQNPDNFVDSTHFVDAVGREIVQKIANELRLLGYK